MFYQQVKTVVNYADAKHEFRDATEAALEALRSETKDQVHTALRRYWFASKQLRVAKATSDSEVSHF